MPRIRSLHIRLQQRRYLRRVSTRAESVLWSYLRNKQFYGLKFRRQYSIGRYILDFYCPKLRLGIELDGVGHTVGRQQEHDRFRTEWLASMYVHIIRFQNEEVLNDPEVVLRKIAKFLTAPHPS